MSVSLLSQRDYDETELQALELALASITAPSRQVLSTAVGREYRRALEARIEELRERLEDV